MNLWVYILLLVHFAWRVLSASTDFKVQDGVVVYKNTTPVVFKGTSWFGFEDGGFVPHGLWVHPMVWYLDFLANNKFNLVRIPFSEQWVKDTFDTQYPDQNMVTADPTLKGVTSLQVLDTLFNECYKRSIFVLMDMHRLKYESQSHQLWYSLDDSTYSAETFHASWKKILDRYQSHPAFHAVDILNEPRGVAEFGTNPSTSWNLFVESFFDVHKYKGVAYVEGINWGSDLSGVRDYPIRVPSEQIVYSPHTYGPSVISSTDMNPTNLRNEWDRKFGFLTKQNKTVIVGEWGGRYVGSDRVWEDTFASYLQEGSNQTSSVYFCLNADSSDTGGLLNDDWTTPSAGKLELLSRLHTYPTLFKRPYLRYSVS